MNRIIPWALAGSGWIALVFVLSLSPESPWFPLRTLAVFAFVLVCPGLAVARLFPLQGTADRWVTAVALSMSFALLVSVAFTLARNDSIPLRMLSLAVVTTVAAAIDVYRSTRRSAGQEVRL